MSIWIWHRNQTPVITMEITETFFGSTSSFQREDDYFFPTSKALFIMNFFQLVRRLIENTTNTFVLNLEKESERSVVNGSMIFTSPLSASFFCTINPSFSSWWQIPIVPHFLYSPNLDTCIFFSKNDFKTQQYDDVETLKTNVIDHLKRLKDINSKSDRRDGIRLYY